PADQFQRSPRQQSAAEKGRQEKYRTPNLVPVDAHQHGKGQEHEQYERGIQPVQDGNRRIDHGPILADRLQEIPDPDVQAFDELHDFSVTIWLLMQRDLLDGMACHPAEHATLKDCWGLSPRTLAQPANPPGPAGRASTETPTRRLTALPAGDYSFWCP